MAVTSIAALCAVLLQISGRASAERNTSIDNMRAMYIAEAGLAEAFNGLYAGKDGAVGSPEIPASFGGGVYWVEVLEQVAGVVLLRSTGLYQGGRSCIQLAVEVFDQSPRSLGVFGDESMGISRNAQVTSFDSSVQSYSEFAASVDAKTGLTLGEAVREVNGDVPLPDIGSNQAVVVGNDTTVVANIKSGVGSAVDLGLSVQLAGTTTPREEGVALPVPEIPIMASSGDQTIPAGSSTLTDGASLRLGNLVVEPGAVVTIRGPADIVLDSFTLAAGAQLEFDSTAGDIRVFVKGDFTLAEGSTVGNTTEDTAGVVLNLLGTDDPARYGTYQQASINLGATAEFFGYLYAPNSMLVVPSQFHVIGGVASRKLDLGRDARVCLDSYLCNTNGQPAEALEPLSWSIQPLPDEQIVVDRRDPFVQLEEDGVVAVKSANAHHIQGFKIRYQDVDGVTRAYDGAEAMFDWSAVGSIDRIAREGEVATFAGPVAISPVVQAKADSIKALKETRDQAHRDGRLSWWRERRLQ